MGQLPVVRAKRVEPLVQKDGRIMWAIFQNSWPVRRFIAGLAFNAGAERVQDCERKRKWAPTFTEPMIAADERPEAGGGDQAARAFQTSFADCALAKGLLRCLLSKESKRNSLRRRFQIRRRAADVSLRDLLLLCATQGQSRRRGRGFRHSSLAIHPE